MTRPPPPAPYETWLDSYLDFNCPSAKLAAAELAELRLAELREEVRVLKAEMRTCLVCGVIMHDPTPDAADEYLRTLIDTMNNVKAQHRTNFRIAGIDIVEDKQ